MINKFFKKYKKAAILLLILNFLFISSTFGSVATENSLKEVDIFPFADPSEERVIDYTENLYEVSDDGMYDSQGNRIRIVEETVPVDSDTSDDEQLKKAANDNETGLSDYSDSIVANWGDKRAFTQYRLNDIKRNLKAEISNYSSIKRTVGNIQKQFEPLRMKIDGLKSQVDLLNKQLLESKNKIKNTELQIAEKQIDLRKLMKELESKKVHFEIQKEIALDYITLVYREEEKFLDYYNSGASTLKLLLANNSVSENLLGLEYSKVLEETGREVFYDLYNKKTELADRQKKIEDQQVKLNQLNKDLSQEKRILEEGKKAKKDLLDATVGKEDAYRKLLEQSIQQQLESSIAIQNMKDSVEFIEGKLNILDSSTEKVESIKGKTKTVEKIVIESEIKELDSKIQKEFEIDLDKQLQAIKKPFIWPVAPRAITAYFHDPTYPKRWGAHNAIDIRAKQFTTIIAPANGYVFQTKDNGMGYSYIILAHKNKFVTVYGHVSEIIAKAGTTVKQGDIIGLSGGTPGTKGAGWQTTGPHLHFEVWHEGEQVDPLNWLDVDRLPEEYRPEKDIETK